MCCTAAAVGPVSPAACLRLLDVLLYGVLEVRLFQGRLVAAGQLHQGVLVLLHFVLRLYQLEKLAPQLAQLHRAGTSIATLGSAQGVCCCAAVAPRLLTSEWSCSSAYSCTASMMLSLQALKFCSIETTGRGSMRRANQVVCGGGKQHHTAYLHDGVVALHHVVQVLRHMVPLQLYSLLLAAPLRHVQRLLVVCAADLLLQ